MAERKELSPRWRYGIAIVFVLVVLVCFGVTFYQVFGPPSGYRERVFPAMRRELSQLPPPEGSTLVDETEYNGAFHEPDIEREYTLSGACADVHTYYSGIAPDNGWSVYRSTYEMNGVFTTIFQKQVGEFRFRLDVQCFSDPSVSRHFGLYISSS
jgi:hypothetical protein